MAKSKRNRTDPKNSGYRQDVVDRIRTTEIVTRVEQFVMGETDKNDQEIIMTAQHVGLISILLNKTLPNLQATSLTGEDGKGPIAIENITRTIVDPKGKK